MKLIIITGASKGLGQALCEQLAQTNNKIWAVSRAFKENTDNVTYLRRDLSVESTFIPVPDGIDEIVFINNAATVSPIGKVGELPLSEISESISVNFAAPIKIVNSLLKHNIPLTILNITTGAANNPVKGLSLYSATKAGIKAFMDSLEGVTVHHIDPGVMDTKMQEVIRNSDFSAVDIFKEWHSKGILKAPTVVASEIISKYL